MTWNLKAGESQWRSPGSGLGPDVYGLLPLTASTMWGNHSGRPLLFTATLYCCRKTRTTPRIMVRSPLLLTNSFIVQLEGEPRPQRGTLGL
ncbi:hypothetical protein J6590_003159 [Homalodisca vitripennis]|nr:hypothetical protein J6590_003159 [Homalodisca vitripennis]